MTDTPKTHHLVANSITAEAVVFPTPTIVARDQLVWQHMYAAARKSRMVAGLEKHAKDTLGGFFDDIFAHASGCVSEGFPD